MKYFILFDDDSNITGAGMSRIVPKGAVVVDPAPVNELVRSYVDPVLGIMPQPASPNPIMDGNTCTLLDCPTGTFVQVADAIGDEIVFEYITLLDAETVAFQIDDAGEYQITVASPAPHYQHIVRVTL